jgi:hypothetical protein
VAAGSISVARRLLSLKKGWSQDLKEVSGFGEECIHECVEHLSTIYGEDEFRRYFN